MITLKNSLILAGLLSFLMLIGCDNANKNALSAKQIAEDQKRYMQQVNLCFLNQYPGVEVFAKPINLVATDLRAQCLDEFSALRAARLNYAMVRDVIEPPPKMVQFEVEMAQVFIETARSRAKLLFKEGSPLPKGHPPIAHPPIPPTAQSDEPERQGAF